MKEIIIEKIKTHWILGLVLVSLLCSIQFIGSIHLFDWDEANFAEIAREMIVTKNYLQPQINFMPFYEKPPFFIWQQVLSMKLFGINEFAARFPNLILGFIVIISLYKIGEKIQKDFGKYWVLSFGLSLAPNFYFKTGLIDPLFNFFIFLSIYFSLSVFKNGNKQSLQILLSGAFAGLAVLTKGPVGLILIIGSIGLGWIITKFKSFNFIYIPIWLVSFSIVSLSWFLWDYLQNGNEFLNQFINYQIRLFETEDANHGGSIFYHPLALLLGCFPASILMWNHINLTKEKTSPQYLLGVFMISCFIIVLIVFSIVQTKIIHYSSLAYYPITYFSAWTLYSFIHQKIDFNKNLVILLTIVSSIWSFALLIAPYLGIHYDVFLTPLIHDINFMDKITNPLIKWNFFPTFNAVISIGVTLYGLYNYFVVNNRKHYILSLFITMFFILLGIQSILHPIEEMVQGEAVRYAQSKQKEDCYFSTFYIKSYNDLFYSQLKPHRFSKEKLDYLWWIYGKNDKKIYYITQISDTSKVNSYQIPLLKTDYNRNGFAFYYRDKAN